MFEGFGFLSSDYSIMDYIRGHSPTGVDPISNEVTVNYPTLNSDETKSSNSNIKLAITGTPGCFLAGNVELVLDNQNEKEISNALNNSLNKFNLSAIQTLSVLSTMRAMDGLRYTHESRLRLIRLRFYCLFIIIHSFKKVDRAFLTQFQCGGTLLKDLLALSDSGSECYSEVGVTCPLSLSSYALECTVGLLESSSKHRGSLHQNDVAKELGLLKEPPESSNNHHDIPWMLIIIGAASSTSIAFSESNIISNEVAELPIVKIQGNSMMDSIEYIRIVLELFAICLNRDQHNTLGDVSVISSLVGLLHSSFGCIDNVLKSLDQTIERSFDSYSNGIHHIISKTLRCLKMCFHMVGHSYQDSLRECDGLSPIINIIELFGLHGPSFLNCNISKIVLENCLAVLSDSMITVRRGIGTAEIGVQVLYQPYFSKLCLNIFSNSFKDNEYLWGYILDVIKSGINVEPIYLAQFLRSEYATVLSSLTKLETDSSPLISNNEGIILQLADLAVQLSITSEGMEFVKTSRLIEFVVNGLVHKSVLLPQSEEGLSTDFLFNCSKSIAHIMRESESAKLSILNNIQKILISIIKELSICKNIEFTSNDQDSSYASPRMHALQKFTNICNLIDGLTQDQSKRHTKEFLREILSEEIIKDLIGTFKYILPPPRQLFAQLGLRQNGTYTYYGYHAAAKALTSVIRIAAQVSSQIVLSVLFKKIDETLESLNKYNQLIRNDVTNLKKNDNYDEDALSNENEFTSLRRKSKISKFAMQQQNIDILGILDYIPNECIFDPSYRAKIQLKHRDIEYNIWAFLVQNLLLEWLSTLLSHSLRTMQKTQVPSLISTGEDTLKKLYSFYRSSLLEVCRFSYTRLSPKVRIYIYIFSVTYFLFYFIRLFPNQLQQKCKQIHVLLTLIQLRILF
jgi:hypothetical protein